MRWSNSRPDFRSPEPHSALAGQAARVEAAMRNVELVETRSIEEQAVVKETARRLLKERGLDKDPKGNTRKDARRSLKKLCADGLYVLDEESKGDG